MNTPITLPFAKHLDVRAKDIDAVRRFDRYGNLRRHKSVFTPPAVITVLTR